MDNQGNTPTGHKPTGGTTPGAGTPGGADNNTSTSTPTGGDHGLTLNTLLAQNNVALLTNQPQPEEEKAVIQPNDINSGVLNLTQQQDNEMTDAFAQDQDGDEDQQIQQQTDVEMENQTDEIQIIENSNLPQAPGPAMEPNQQNQEVNQHQQSPAQTEQIQQLPINQISPPSNDAANTNVVQ